MSAVPSMPGVFPILAKRWEPFDDTIKVEGVDMTGCTLTMQVRQYKDQPGDPLINLAMVSPTGQGLSLSVAGGDTTIRIIINETTIEGLLPFGSNGTEQNENLVLQWAMIISGTGFKKTRWFEGDFIIEPGANQA